MSKGIEFDFLTHDTRYPNFDFESYLTEKDVEFKIMDSGDHKEWALNCPSCMDRGEPSHDIHKKLWVNVQKGEFHCYRCKWSGPMTRLIEKMSNIPFGETMKVLRGEQLDPLDALNLKLYEEHYDFDEDEDDLHEIEMPYGYIPIEGPHPYLNKRGIPWKYAANHDWGFSKAGYTKDRIIVPTIMEGKVVYWQARATWEEPGNKDFKKVLNPKGVSAKSILYNYDIAKTHETIVIVEGFIDAVKTGPNAMATNGKRLHAEQVEWLRKTGAQRIIMCWDLDSWTDGKRNKEGDLVKPCSMRRAVDQLRVYFKDIRCVKMPKGRDPGSYPYRSEELQRLIKTSKKPKFST
jgi:hypothetical protein